MLREFAYDNNDALIGEVIKGELVPLTEALTGDDLDFLVYDCGKAIENYFGNYEKRPDGSPRLHPELKSDDGQQSTVLSTGRTMSDVRKGHDGIRSWVIQGTLRTVDQLTPEIRSFAEDMKVRQAMGKVPKDWQFDNDCMIVFGTRFGLTGPTTFAERQAQKAADRERWEKEQEERRQRDAKSAREMQAKLAEYEAELKRQERISELLRAISVRLYPVVGSFEDETSEDYQYAAQNRRVFKRSTRAFIEMRIDEGKTDAEIRQEVVMDWCAKLSPGELDPLLEGETRTFYDTPEAILADFENYAKWAEVLREHKIITQQDLDGRFVITVVAMDKTS